METFKKLLKEGKIIKTYYDSMLAPIFKVDELTVYAKYFEYIQDVQTLMLLSELGYPNPFIIGYDVIHDGYLVYSSSPSLWSKLTSKDEAFVLMNENSMYFLGVLFDLLKCLSKMQDAYAASLSEVNSVVVWVDDDKTGITRRANIYKNIPLISYYGINVCISNTHLVSLIMYGKRTNSNLQEYSPVSYSVSVWQVLKSLYEQTAKLKLDNLAKYILTVTYDLFEIDPLSPKLSERKYAPRGWLGFLYPPPHIQDWELPKEWYKINYFQGYRSVIAKKIVDSTSQMIHKLSGLYSSPNVFLTPYYPREKHTNLYTPSLAVYTFRKNILNIETVGVKPSTEFDKKLLTFILNDKISSVMRDRLYTIVSANIEDLSAVDLLYIKFLKEYKITRGRTNTPAIMHALPLDAYTPELIYLYTKKYLFEPLVSSYPTITDKETIEKARKIIQPPPDMFSGPYPISKV